MCLRQRSKSAIVGGIFVTSYVQYNSSKFIALRDVLEVSNTVRWVSVTIELRTSAVFFVAVGSPFAACYYSFGHYILCVPAIRLWCGAWGVSSDIPAHRVFFVDNRSQARGFSFSVPFVSQGHLQGLAAKEEEKRAAFMAQMGLKAGQKITIQPRRDG